MVLTMKKSLVALLLSILIMVSFFPIEAMSAGMDEETFDKKLAEYIKAHPNKSQNPVSGECFGFANDMAKYIFGSRPSGSMKAPSGSVNSNWTITRGAKAINNVCKGDIIRVNLHDDVDHSMFVTLVTSDAIYVSDANWDHNNTVYHYKIRKTRDQFKTLLDRALKLGTDGSSDLKGYVAHFKGSSFSADTVKPSAPTGLKGTWVATTDKSMKFKIQWTAADRADYYEVKYSTDGSSYSTDSSYSIPVNTSFNSVFKNKTNLSAYYFEVRAVNEAGKSAFTKLTVKTKATVTFDPNGGVVSKTSMSVTYKDGKLPTYGTLPVPTKTGYSFDGWYTKAEGGTKIESSTTINGPKTVYAHWTANTTYEISFNPNGGTDAPAVQTKTHDIALTLTTDQPTRSGWYFLGWAESANAAASEYLPGDSFSKNAETILYAVWGYPDFVLPSELTEIEDEAFVGTMFTFVELPEQAVSISRNAFADCPNLSYIYIPALTTQINDQAFGELQHLTIFGKTGTTAESYAQEHRFNFIVVP